MTGEANTEGPKGWTPVVEQDPEQKKLRAKVDENIAERTANRRINAPKRLAEARKKLATQVKNVGQTIDEEANRVSELYAKAQLAKKVASLQGIKGIGRDIAMDQNKIYREEGSNQRSDPSLAGETIAGVINRLSDEYTRQGDEAMEEATRKVAGLKTSVDMTERGIRKLEPDEQYHRDQYWQLKRRPRSREALEQTRQARKTKGLLVSYGQGEAVQEKPFHGGLGEGVVHIVKRTPLGQKTKDDPQVVGQNALDVSNEKTRYNLAPQVEFFNSDSGATDVRRRFETITFFGDRGVIVFAPETGQVSDILQPDVFQAMTKKTGGLLSLDMSTARHNLRERNPVITAMVKDALRATITMLGAAKPAEGVSPADMSVLAGRRQALEGQLASLQ